MVALRFPGIARQGAEMIAYWLIYALVCGLVYACASVALSRLLVRRLVV